MVGTVPGEQGTPGFSGGLSGVAKKNRIDTPDLRKGQCWGPTARSPTGLATRPRLPCGAGGHPVANVSSQRVSSDTRGPRNPASGGSPQLPQRGGDGRAPESHARTGAWGLSFLPRHTRGALWSHNHACGTHGEREAQTAGTHLSSSSSRDPPELPVEDDRV